MDKLVEPGKGTKGLPFNHDNSRIRAGTQDQAMFMTLVFETTPNISDTESGGENKQGPFLSNQHQGRLPIPSCDSSSIIVTIHM